MKRRLFRAATALTAVLAGVGGCAFDTSVAVTNGGDVLGGSPDAGEPPALDASASDASASDASAASAEIVPTGGTSESGLVGGFGGGNFGPIACPEGEMLVGMDGEFYLGGDDGAGFCRVHALCSKVRVNAGGQLEHFGEVSALPTGAGIGFCGGNTSAVGPRECAAHQVVVGLSGRTSGSFGAVTEIQLRCATVNQAGQVEIENFTESFGSIINNSTSDVSKACPDQTVATGLTGRSGAIIDAMGLECRSVSVAP